ncbi:MAG: 30S ribosomal protein S3 [Candidatus Thermoplasmatota archaeon]|nr:30S ribosomal protein S3 [Candidatus Thermoplasmatota archaeon]
MAKGRKENIVRTFINRNVERHLVKEFLLHETQDAGFGGLTFKRTPEGEMIVLEAENVGRVIGTRGRIINELTRRLEQDFNLYQPKLEVGECEKPALNAQIMASRIASSLERGWFFRRAANSTVMNIMNAGARGCLIVLSGKVSGARNRSHKFQVGHIKFCGETALTSMDVGYAVAVKKLGTIGCTVAIMRPGTRLPNEIIIKSREEVGLEPLPHDYEITESIVETQVSEDEADSNMSEDEMVQATVQAMIDADTVGEEE